MQSSTIEYKVKVFISSSCDDRFKIVRRAIKRLLLETNMAQVYVFEDYGASSQDVITHYLNNINDSDICLFIIDNKDNVSGAVLSEQKRARALNKKSVYIFCDENEKTPTQMQNEINSGYREKYQVVHEFKDIIDASYCSLLNDIIGIYRQYCNGQLIDKERETSEELTIQTYNSYTIDKTVFCGFDNTEIELANLVFQNHKAIEHSTEIDLLFKYLLSLIIGKADIDLRKIVLLKDQVCAKHEDYLHKFIKHRFNAIYAYYEGDLDKCLTELNLAYMEAVDEKRIPNWLKNDVAIDLRYLYQIIDETNNKIDIKNIGQQHLDENIERIYYPLLDRLESSSKKELLNKLFSVLTASIYSTNIGGIESHLKGVANIYCVAAMYGSLTHLLYTRERLIDTLTTLYIEYNDHSMYIELIRMLILTRKQSETRKILNSFEQPTDQINEGDVISLLSSINSIPVSHYKTISKCLVVQHYGLYLSDEKYNNETSELLRRFSEWISDDKRINVLGQHFFAMLKSNIKRIDNNKIAVYMISIYSNRLYRYYDDMCEILSSIKYESLSSENQNMIKNILVQIVANDEIMKLCHKMSNTLIHFRLSANIDTADLDACVLKNMERFYRQEYSLSVFTNSEDENIAQILCYVDEIKMMNLKQGKDGVYTGFGHNPYGIIRNIIDINGINPNPEIVQQILFAVEETLFAPRQGIMAKNQAIQLAIYLRNRFPSEEFWKSFIANCETKQDFIFQGEELDFWEKDTISLLKLNYSLLSLCFKNYSFERLMVDFASISKMSDYDSARVLHFIESLLYKADYSSIDLRALAILMQYTLTLSAHKEVEARFLVVKILVMLSRSSFREAALTQLSRMMDCGTYQIKIAILSRLTLLDDEHSEIVKYIRLKGKIDNHYLVRSICN